MKTYYTLIYLLISFGASSQSIQESIETVNTTEQAKFKKLKVKSVTQWYYMINEFGATNKDGTKSEVKSYDQNGNKTAYWDLSTQYTFKYDINGRKIESINKDGNSMIRKSWSYDSNNNCIEHSTIIDGKRVSSIAYLYDLNHNCTQENTTNVPMYGGSYVSRIFYVYDNAGNKIEKYNEVNGIKSLEKKWKYDDNHNMIEELYYFQNKLENKRSFKFDTENRLAEDIWFDGKGNYTGVGRTTYTYDSKGNLTEKKNIDSAGKITSANNYSYNGDNRIISVTMDAITFVSSEHYKYNEKGLLSELTMVGNKVFRYVYEYY